MAASPPAFSGVCRGRNCYITAAFSGDPNAKRGEKIRSAYVTSTFLGAQTRVVHSRGSPTPRARRKSKVVTSPLLARGCRRGQKCYGAPTFSGSPTPSAGRKSEVASSPLPSRGPRRGRKCYVPARSRGGGGDAKGGEENRSGHPPLPSQGPKRGRKCYATLHSGGSPTPSARGKSEVAASALPSWGPGRRRMCYVTAAFSRVYNAKCGAKIRSGYLTCLLQS